MSNVIMYTTAVCPYCVRAKALLDNKKIKYTEIAVDTNAAELENMKNITGRRTVPQIIIDNKAIGGCDDLYALERAGQLDQLLGIK